MGRRQARGGRLSGPGLSRCALGVPARAFCLSRHAKSRSRLRWGGGRVRLRRAARAFFLSRSSSGGSRSTERRSRGSKRRPARAFCLSRRSKGRASSHDSGPSRSPRAPARAFFLSPNFERRSARAFCLSPTSSGVARRARRGKMVSPGVATHSSGVSRCSSAISRPSSGVSRRPRGGRAGSRRRGPRHEGRHRLTPVGHPRTSGCPAVEESRRPGSERPPSRLGDDHRRAERPSLLVDGVAAGVHGRLSRSGGGQPDGPPTSCRYEAGSRPRTLRIASASA
jgi:hypothetical protein